MNEFLTWCDEHIAACQQRKQELLQDQRGDEAKFEQIRANVYGIFRAVYAALYNHPDALARKLQDIPAAWEVSLRLAEEHGDAEKAHIERIKLATTTEILREVPHDGK